MSSSPAHAARRFLVLFLLPHRGMKASRQRCRLADDGRAAGARAAPPPFGLRRRARCSSYGASVDAAFLARFVIPAPVLPPSRLRAGFAAARVSSILPCQQRTSRCCTITYITASNFIPDIDIVALPAVATPFELSIQRRRGGFRSAMPPISVQDGDVLLRRPSEDKRILLVYLPSPFPVDFSM